MDIFKNKVIYAIILCLFRYLCLVFFRWVDTGYWDIIRPYTIISGNRITIINYYGSGGQTTTGGIVETGIEIDLQPIITGGINTGDILNIDKELTYVDLYNQYKSSGNYRSYFPSSQSRISGNYGTNTEYMTSYLSNHTFRFSLPSGVGTGYLYFRLKKNTQNDVFAYWYNSDYKGYKVSGDINKKGNLISGSQTEFLYKLNEIPYEAYSTKTEEIYNWQYQLTRDKNYIAMFVKDFDGSNQIEEITIAWE